jgi:uncharacterized protein (DUF362 family)
MKKVSKVKFENNLRDTVLRTVDLVGGFGKFIKKGDTVLIKPNFNTADPYPASTDPEFLRTVVELIYEHGVKKVIVGDSSTFMANTRRVMEKLRIFYLEKGNNSAEVVVFDEKKWIKKKVPDGKYLKTVYLPEILDKIDKLILLPCLKTHSMAQFTGALKLSVGFIKPTQRMRMHVSHLQEKAVELNKLINPALIIMDGRKCFITKGPATGELREPNLILSSDDRVAIDVEGIKIIENFKGNSLKNINPWEISQIKAAVDFNIGVKNENEYEVV